MKARVKRLWLKALRSGKYQQGKNQLRNGDRFCCLGVLCEVYRQDTGKGRWTRGESFVAGDSEDCCVLPDAVMAWAALSGDTPRLGPRKNSAYATTLNDNGRSFSYIADRIEKYL